MADPNAQWADFDVSTLIPAGPSAGRIVRSHKLFWDDVPSEPPPLPAKPEPWNLTPEEILSISSPGCPAYVRRMEGPIGALGKLKAAKWREWIAQERAMNAPFVSLQRERFAARQTDQPMEGFCESSDDAARSLLRARVGADSRERSEPLAGLVTSKTSQTQAVERIEIDRIHARITRLKKAVHNGTHALDSDAHVNGGGFRWTRVFVTLSYASVEDWEPGHIAQFADAVRKWFKRTVRAKFRMQWVLELQKRGAVHYHCMIWVPSRFLFPYPDKQGWWKHGTSNLSRVAGGIQRPVSYMAKYTSKVNSHQCSRVPKGARMHGCNGLNEEGRRWVRWWRSPLFAREALGGAADIRKVKGGYMDKLTGEFHESPWRVTVTPGGRVYAWRVDAQIN